MQALVPHLLKRCFRCSLDFHPPGRFTGRRLATRAVQRPQLHDHPLLYLRNERHGNARRMDRTDLDHSLLCPIQCFYVQVPHVLRHPEAAAVDLRRNLAVRACDWLLRAALLHSHDYNLISFPRNFGPWSYGLCAHITLRTTTGPWLPSIFLQVFPSHVNSPRTASRSSASATIYVSPESAERTFEG